MPSTTLYLNCTGFVDLSQANPVSSKLDPVTVPSILFLSKPGIALNGILLVPFAIFTLYIIGSIDLVG